MAYAYLGQTDRSMLRTLSAGAVLVGAYPIVDAKAAVRLPVVAVLQGRLQGETMVHPKVLGACLVGKMLRRSVYNRLSLLLRDWRSVAESEGDHELRDAAFVARGMLFEAIEHGEKLGAAIDRMIEVGVAIARSRCYSEYETNRQIEAAIHRHLRLRY